MVHNLFTQCIFIKINVTLGTNQLCEHLCYGWVSAESLILKAEQTWFYSLKTAVPITWIASTCKSLKDFSVQAWCYKADL